MVWRRLLAGFLRWSILLFVPLAAWLWPVQPVWRRSIPNMGHWQMVPGNRTLLAIVWDGGQGLSGLSLDADTGATLGHGPLPRGMPGFDREGNRLIAWDQTSETLMIQAWPSLEVLREIPLPAALPGQPAPPAGKRVFQLWNVLWFQGDRMVVVNARYFHNPTNGGLDDGAHTARMIDATTGKTLKEHAGFDSFSPALNGDFMFVVRPAMPATKTEPAVPPQLERIDLPDLRRRWSAPLADVPNPRVQHSGFQGFATAYDNVTRWFDAETGAPVDAAIPKKLAWWAHAAEGAKPWTWSPAGKFLAPPRWTSVGLRQPTGPYALLEREHPIVDSVPWLFNTLPWLRWRWSQVFDVERRDAVWSMVDWPVTRNGMSSSWMDHAIDAERKALFVGRPGSDVIARYDLPAEKNVPVRCALAAAPWLAWLGWRRRFARKDPRSHASIP